MVSWCRKAVDSWHFFFLFCEVLCVCGLIYNWLCWWIRIDFCFELSMNWIIWSLLNIFPNPWPNIDFAKSNRPEYTHFRRICYDNVIYMNTINMDLVYRQIKWKIICSHCFQKHFLFCSAKLMFHRRFKLTFMLKSTFCFAFSRSQINQFHHVEFNNSMFVHSFVWSFIHHICSFIYWFAHYIWRNQCGEYFKWGKSRALCIGAYFVYLFYRADDILWAPTFCC